MKRIILILAALLVLLLLASCASAPVPTEIPTEPSSVPTQPVVTTPPVTEPPATEAPTEPPEPTIPPLGVSAGSLLESYHSETYNDYFDYYIHFPENAVEGMPLIVYLHGDGEVNNPDRLLEYGLCRFVKAAYGEEYPCIVLEPVTRRKSWTDGNIPELLIELIEYTMEQYHVDPDKVILTGFSRGSMGVWDVISTYPEYFSAAVPVSSPHKAGHIDYTKACQVPVWTFAGDIGDTERWYHKYLAQNVDQITVLGGYGKFTVLEDCDHNHAPGSAYTKELFDWALSQQRGVIPEE